MTLALKNRDERSIFLVAGNRYARYGSPVAANSATGLGNPISKRRNSAPITIAGAFFVPAVTCYGGCAWEAFVPAGFLLPRFTNLRTAATHSLGNERGSSSAEGASPMKHALNPSKIRAHAHRRLALAALRANSSLSVRLARYNHHAEIARALEGQGGAQ
ncbi:hypothetical protein [Pseudomonas juntendi]|uniref:hypothetical protein n=1 Tax=Pseudomonas juntendi TaxID=2666183 RepID=UPI00244B7355|nr:hypothetical protein [Pseudomonas juntendi]MDG9887153.1 hypothetical protein [Pseudomonas juntendi]